MQFLQTQTTLFYERMSNMVRHQLIAFLGDAEFVASTARLDPREFALIMQLAQTAGVSEDEFMSEFDLSLMQVGQLTYGTGLRPHPKQHEIVLWLQERLRRVGALEWTVS